ncbi:MAG: metalloregulator ArsR/SmtB family transcription factor [Pseudomonadota bacterium]
MPEEVENLKTSQSRAMLAADMLRAIAHPSRLRILALLCEREEHVSALAELLGLKQAIISQQLRILRSQRLVEVKRENGFSYYGLAEPRLKEFIRCVEGCTGH